MPHAKPGKHPTQGMVDDGLKGAPDGTMPVDTRGAGGGGPLAKGSGKGFHGGQSNAAYHGPGQLGDQDVDGHDNPNAVSRES